jgi:predicted RNA-binding Zn ribbon-like protein
MNTQAPLHPPATDHVHADVDLETAFDFLNTLELESGALTERLHTFDDAVSWLEDRRVLPEPDAVRKLGRTSAGASAALEKIIETRNALRNVAHSVAHEETPARADIDEVNRALRSREQIQLIPDAEGCRLGHTHVGDPLDDALARIAEPIVRKIGEGQDERFRICANDTCRWIFFDESRTGRRRWCDMATCGNRAKARRHRERAKQAEAEAAAAGAPDQTRLN